MAWHGMAWHEPFFPTARCSCTCMCCSSELAKLDPPRALKVDPPRSLGVEAPDLHVWSLFGRVVDCSCRYVISSKSGTYDIFCERKMTKTPIFRGRTGEGGSIPDQCILCCETMDTNPLHQLGCYMQCCNILPTYIVCIKYCSILLSATRCAGYHFGHVSSVPNQKEI